MAIPALRGTESGPDTSACPLCGSTATPVVWRESGYVGRGCGCGLVFLDPPPAPGDVDLTEELHSDEYYRAPAEVRIGFVERMTPGRRLLEVGCGAGCFLEVARRHGFEVAGMEPDAERAARAEARLGIPIGRDFVEDAAPPRDAFDVVFHVDLMSHFPDPERALRALAGQLRDGGLVCFEAGVLGGMSPRWYRWHGGVEFPVHRWLYSENAMRSMLARADLEVVHIERYGLLAVHAYGWIRRWIGRGLRSAQLDPKSDAVGRSTARLWSDKVEAVLRYRVGRFMPGVGPQALFVAARPAPR